MQDGLWYFAYGSNMCATVFRDRRGLTPLHARPAVLEDHRLVFTLPIGPGERGVANLEAAAGAWTCGVVYLLSSADCERLDRTEGVHVGVYRRAPVRVWAADGESVMAFTYRSSFHDPSRKPSARYLGLLLDGAREHGLPDTWLRWLEGWPLAFDEREQAR